MGCQNQIINMLSCPLLNSSSKRMNILPTLNRTNKKKIQRGRQFNEKNNIRKEHFRYSVSYQLIHCYCISLIFKIFKDLYLILASFVPFPSIYWPLNMHRILQVLSLKFQVCSDNVFFLLFSLLKQVTNTTNNYTGCKAIKKIYFPYPILEVQEGNCPAVICLRLHHCH